MAGAQVLGGRGSDTLEALPVAFSATGWLRCVLRWPPTYAILPLVGEMAQCRHGPARVFTHLEVWAPNMFPAEAEPLPPAAFHPPPPA